MIDKIIFKNETFNITEVFIAYILGSSKNNERFMLKKTKLIF